MQESAFLQGGGLQVGSLWGGGGGKREKAKNGFKGGAITRKIEGSGGQPKYFSICRVEMMIHYLNKTTHTKQTKGI